MDATAAERQRRYRKHNKDDHSLCPPERDCRTGEQPVSSPVTLAVTRNEPTRSQRLWNDMGGDALTGDRRVLLDEACRITDRLDALHRLLSGDARDWLDIVDTKGNPDRQELVVDKLLAESRQQATALKQIFAELRQGGAGGEVPETGGSVLDQLAAKRAARIANATGS